MKKLLPLSVLIALIAGFHLQLSFAQTNVTAERPALMAGDSWTYRQLDGWSNAELSQTQLIFTSTESERLIFQLTNKSNDTRSPYITNADLNPCRSMKGSTDLVCAGTFKFPMTVGQKTSHEKMPFESGLGYGNNECVVKAAEKVTVPAGTFDTFRIECSGYWQRVLEGNRNGSDKSTRWYAPSVKQSVKTTSEVTWNSKVQDKKTTELVAFKIQ